MEIKIISEKIKNSYLSNLEEFFKINLRMDMSESDAEARVMKYVRSMDEIKMDFKSTLKIRKEKSSNVRV